MTRDQLQQIRDALKTLRPFLGFTAITVPEASQHGLDVCDESLAIIDAELAKPENREWRILYKVFPTDEEWQIPGIFRRENAMQFAFGSLGECHNKRIESRNPAGPWEAA